MSDCSVSISIRLGGNVKRTRATEIIEHLVRIEQLIALEFKKRRKLFNISSYYIFIDFALNK